MDKRTEQIALTTGVIALSILLIALGFLGFSLVAGLLLICIIWAVYFFLITR